MGPDYARNVLFLFFVFCFIFFRFSFLTSLGNSLAPRDEMTVFTQSRRNGLRVVFVLGKMVSRGRFDRPRVLQLDRLNPSNVNAEDAVMTCLIEDKEARCNESKILPLHSDCSH